MKAELRREGFEANLLPFLHGLHTLDHGALEATVAALEQDGLDLDGDTPAVVLRLARAGFVEFSMGGGALTLTPSREDFTLPAAVKIGGRWKVSKFLSITPGAAPAPHGLVAQSPLADCKIRIHDNRILHLLQAMVEPVVAADIMTSLGFGDEGAAIIAALAHALVILPCDDGGRTIDETDPLRKMWDPHDLIFHARSRLGRSGVRTGATWAFRGDIPEPSPTRENPWAANAIALYRPHLLSRDMSLFEAMETRRSIRHYSANPLTLLELGEFLFRAMRVRGQVWMPDGSHYLSRPYPNGGAMYEQELFVTIDACADLRRGVYYYDAVQHALCPVAEPSPDMEALIDEAAGATAYIGRPQILFTIASRFERFNWKYSGMAYAAQLKNIGVIYQTMYLVATAMGIGGCGLGLGNSDRFARLTGRPWLEEGSIGEFMIGRPA